MNANKIELTSDNGKIHAIIEDFQGLKELGIDPVSELTAVLKHEENLERASKLEELKNINEELVYLGDKPEQYADAIVGITYDGNHIIYSVEKFAECLKKEDLTDEETADWISYNTARAIPYMGEYAPILMNEMER